MVSYWVILALSALSAVIVSLGVFFQVNGIVGKRRSYKGILLKVLGLLPLFAAIRWGRDEIVGISLTFFVTASFSDFPLACTQEASALGTRC